MPVACHRCHEVVELGSPTVLRAVTLVHHRAPASHQPNEGPEVYFHRKCWRASTQYRLKY